MGQPLLEGNVAEVSIDRVQELRDEFEEYQRQAQQAFGRLHEQISVLRQGLRIAAGDEVITAGGDPRLQNLDKWEAIKRRLGQKEAELIDVLLTSGPRTNSQLKPLLRLGYSTVCALTLRMSNMGFITKQGDCYALKEN